MQSVPQGEEDQRDQPRDELALKGLQPLVHVTQGPVVGGPIEVDNHILGAEWDDG